MLLVQHRSWIVYYFRLNTDSIDAPSDPSPKDSEIDIDNTEGKSHYEPSFEVVSRSASSIANTFKMKGFLSSRAMFTSHNLFRALRWVARNTTL